MITEKEIKKRTQNEISIIMSADNNYAFYLGVTIKSIVVHASPKRNYTIYILDGETHGGGSFFDGTAQFAGHQSLGLGHLVIADGEGVEVNVVELQLIALDGLVAALPYVG